MSTNPVETKTTDDQSAFQAFVKARKIVPVELVTFANTSNLLGLVDSYGGQRLSLPKAQRRSRKAQNAKFSGIEEQSTYGRISVNGVPVHDTGYEFVDKEAAMQVGNLRKLIKLLGDTAQLVIMVEEIDKGDETTEKSLPSKIEIRNRPTYGEGAEGLIPVKAILASLEEVPNSARVGVRLWVNPDKKGWFKYNLVVGNCNQRALGKLPLISIEPIVESKVLTLDPVPLGIDLYI